MRPFKGILIASLSLLCLGGLATGVALGVTKASSYQAPVDSNAFGYGTMASSDFNFQPLSYYFAGGEGTEALPFLIKNSQQLRNLAKLYNLGLMGTAPWVSLSSSFQYEGDPIEPIGTFANPWTGVFNGQNFLITGLEVATSSATYVGMFGVVGANNRTGTVRQLVLAGPSVSYTGSTAAKIGIIAGSRNITTNYVSVVEDIAVYGGTANFSNVRASIRCNSTPTCTDGLVGENGVKQRAGFVSALSTNETDTTEEWTAYYTATATTNAVNSSGTWSIYHNGSSVVATKS